MTLTRELAAGAKFNRARFGGEMKRFERGGKDSWAAAPAAAAAPASVDFFGTARAPIQPVEAARRSPSPAAGKAAKRARMPSGKASTTLRSKDDGAGAHSSDDDDDSESAGGEREIVSDDEGDGVQLFSGGEMTKGTADVEQAAGKKGKKAATKSARDANAREELAVFRRQMRISVAGDEVPPPAGSFEEMRFPKEAGWLRSGIEAAGTCSLSVYEYDCVHAAWATFQAAVSEQRLSRAGAP